MNKETTMDAWIHACMHTYIHIEFRLKLVGVRSQEPDNAHGYSIFET